MQESAPVRPEPVQPNDDAVLFPVIPAPMLPPQLSNTPPGEFDRDGSSLQNLDPARLDRFVQRIMAQSTEAGRTMVGSNASAAYNDGPLVVMMTSVLDRCNTIDFKLSNQNTRLNSMVSAITRLVMIMLKMPSADDRIQRSLEMVNADNLVFSTMSSAAHPPAKP